MSQAEALQIIKRYEQNNDNRLLLFALNLTSLPHKIGSLANLKTLYLDHNYLASLPHEIGALTKLENLYLKNNRLTGLPHEIGKLTSLKNQDFSYNALAFLPKEIGALTKLKILYLSNNKLTFLPHEIGALTNLTKVFLSNNQLTDLPSEIGALTNLESLYLKNNKLTHLPAEIGTLTKLENLYLQNNKLTSLPREIGNLTSLKSQDFRHNELVSLPQEIGELTKLKVLYLSHNKLTFLPPEIGALTSLHSIYLDNNKLTNLPHGIGTLTELRGLNLSNNQIASLPHEIGSLLELANLDLSNNQIASLPHEIGNMTYLTNLDLSNNQIASLPHEIGNMTFLTNLNLSNNQITSLPHEIGSLTLLDKIDLKNNPLHPELMAAYRQGTDALKLYLKEKDKKQIVLNEAKLIFVGEGEVGKTSLLGALRGDPWVENRETTHGIEVSIKPLTIIDSKKNSTIMLNCWDFGGQRVYRHTHQLFFTAPAIYLAVWNPRRGHEQCRVGEWIKLVKQRSYDEKKPETRPRIIVVATHGGPKERQDHIDKEALRDEFGSLIFDFTHIDSKPDPKNRTCHGLDDLKEKISHTAGDIPQVGRTVPATWKKVLDAIRERANKVAWISYDQYLSLCANCCEAGVEPNLVKMYLALLNELGHLIHYSTDSVLKHIIILKPEWLSKAISYILEDKVVKEHNGLVTHDRLHEIWNDPSRAKDRYPKEMSPVFLKLMERFDLSYQVVMPEQDAPASSLIAQLVPSSRPTGWEKDWIQKPGDSERIQVCRLLDAETGRASEGEGLIYRLIVRLHRFSLGRYNFSLSRHWKNGILLDDEYNGRAFIEDVAGDIYIRVRAAYPERFLGHLCAEVQWLVNYFWKGLDARLYTPCPGPCKGLLEQEEMISNIEEGIPKIRCSVCKKYHDIDSLLAPNAHKPKWQDALTELNHGQQQIRLAVESGFDSVSVQLRTLLSQADEQFAALLSAFTDPAKDGPRLFSFAPVEPNFFDAPQWITKKFKLILWCEHSRLPLHILDEKQQNIGIYEIELSRGWLEKAAPIFGIISATLSLTLPVAIPAAKLALSTDTYKAIDEQLKFGVKAAESFLKGSKQVGGWLVNENIEGAEYLQNNIKKNGAAIRQIHALLQSLDPTKSYGGLERVQNKRHEYLWVHPKFVDEY